MKITADSETLRSAAFQLNQPIFEKDDMIDSLVAFLTEKDITINEIRAIVIDYLYDKAKTQKVNDHEAHLIKNVSADMLEILNVCRKINNLPEIK